MHPLPDLKGIHAPLPHLKGFCAPICPLKGVSRWTCPVTTFYLRRTAGKLKP